MSYFTVEKQKRRNSTGSISSDPFEHSGSCSTYTEPSNSSCPSTSTSSETSDIPCFLPPVCVQKRPPSSFQSITSESFSSHPGSSEEKVIFVPEREVHVIDHREYECSSDGSEKEPSEQTCFPYYRESHHSLEERRAEQERFYEEAYRLNRKIKRTTDRQINIAIEEIMAAKDEAITEIDNAKKEYFYSNSCGSSNEEVEKLREDVDKLTVTIDSLTKILFRS